MPHRLTAVLFLVAALAQSGCTPSVTCAAGTSRVGDVCVAVDASPNLPDGGRDANVDAPMPDAHVPCGGACTGATPQCDVATDTCVECLTNEHCTEVDASVCGASHVCEGCGASADCTHLTASPVCDAAAMTCVECTASELSGCTSGICLTSTGTCAPTGGATATCGTCTRDAECHAGQLCVVMTFHSMPAGSHCAWRQDAAGSGAPNGNCAMVAPYVNGAAVTSVDGVSAMGCTPRVSTCDALAAFGTGGAGAGGPCTGPTTGTSADPDCGAPSLDDGFCRLDSSYYHYCTVECTTMADCPCTGVSCAAHYPCSSGVCSLNP